MKQFPYSTEQLQELYAARKLNGPAMVQILSNWNDHARGFRIDTDHYEIHDETYSVPPYVEVVYTAFAGDTIIAQASYASRDGEHTAWMQTKAHTKKGNTVFALLLSIAQHCEENQVVTLQDVW